MKDHYTQRNKEENDERAKEEKSTKLTKNSVGEDALMGTNKKLIIKVPKKMVKKYKKYFKDTGNNAAKVKN